MKSETKRLIRKLGWILFAVYLILLLYFLFFSEWYGRSNWRDTDYRYNLELFKEIRRFWTYREQLGMEAVFLNIFGNVIGFMPLGFILPVISRRLRPVLFSTMTGLLFSFAVECMQLVAKVGSFDVDDMLLNTVGTLIGCLLFKICNRIRRKL